MQRNTQADPNKPTTSVHQIRSQINRSECEGNEPHIQQNSGEQQRRIVELLGIALTRLSGRGGLSKTVAPGIADDSHAG